MIGGETDKAVAFSKEGLNFLSAEISSLVSTRNNFYAYTNVLISR